MPLFPFEIEGTVEDIAADPNGATIKVSGLTIFVDNSVAGRALRSPTNKRMTMAMLLTDEVFPGRAPLKGFRGGTVIAKGNFDLAANRYEVKIPTRPDDQGDRPFEEFPSIEIEPGENVLLGRLTSTLNPNLTVNGVKVALLPGGVGKPMPGEPVKNEFGFEVKPETIAPLSLTSCEGYYSAADSTFHAHTITVDGEATLTISTPQISITRAQARNRGAEYDVDIRGGFTQTHIPPGGPPQVIEVHRVDVIDGEAKEDRLGLADVRILAGNFGRWRFNSAITVRATAPYDRAPSHIRVKNLSAPGTPRDDEEDVEIIKQ